MRARMMPDRAGLRKRWNDARFRRALLRRTVAEHGLTDRLIRDCVARTLAEAITSGGYQNPFSTRRYSPPC